MLYHLPHPADAPQAPQSLHSLFNTALEDLKVVCLGSKDGCLYFERGDSSLDMDDLARKIIQQMNSNPTIAEWARREHITKIAIK